MWDFRKGKFRFAGIVVQEFDAKAGKLVGPITNVLSKPDISEGPNIYKRNGYYYLMLAEGGTSWRHGISMARSRNITGPYELDPQEMVLTSRNNPECPLQKAGHGELVETQTGEWYLAHLASRPVGTGENRRCMLGRETNLQRVEWSADGWLRLAGGGVVPALEVPSPKDLPVAAPKPRKDRDDFDSPKLDVNWSSLRVPVDESWLSLSERPGWLRLRGRESLQSMFYQSLVARRLQDFNERTTICASRRRKTRV